MGAVLSQVHEGKERVIAYASMVLSKSERQYCVTRKELLAVVYFTKYFKHYLYGRKFILRTDHSSLSWLTTFKNPEGQLAWWLEVLSTYNMEIQHRPGKQHLNADALSRLTCRQCGYDIDDDKEPHVRGAKTDSKDFAFDVPYIKTIQDNDKELKLVKEWMDKEKKPDSFARSLVKGYFYVPYGHS